MINGILNVYKEPGFTSHDVVAKLRGILKQKKIGHTGTLDPDAKGVLPVCLGRATKLCELLGDETKTYEAVLRLGIVTDTQDMSGQVLEEFPVNVSEQQTKEAILSFVGEYMQVPPMYSALKVNGQKLCDLARQGKVVERKARRVQLFEIEILKVNLPNVTFRVTCSKGTYIRTLCQDIGEKLGCGGCMELLERTRVGKFEKEQSLTLSEIEELAHAGKAEDVVMTIEQFYSHLPAVYGLPETDRQLKNGNDLPFQLASGAEAFSEMTDLQQVRLYDSTKTFIGIYRCEQEQQKFHLVKMFLEVSQ